MLIPRYPVLLWLKISAVPKPPNFGSKALSSLKLLTDRKGAVVGEDRTRGGGTQDGSAKTKAVTHAGMELAACQATVTVSQESAVHFTNPHGP